MSDKKKVETHFERWTGSHTQYGARGFPVTGIGIHTGPILIGGTRTRTAEGKQFSESDMHVKSKIGGQLEGTTRPSKSTVAFVVSAGMG